MEQTTTVGIVFHTICSFPIYECDEIRKDSIVFVNVIISVELFFIGLFCRCSRYETEIRRLRILKPVRVCQACYNVLRAQQAAEAVSQNKV